MKKEQHMALVTDPVCKMEIDPKTAAGKSDWNGQTYYFCSLGCKREFDKDPGHFLGNTAGASSGHQH
jgi:YHS domain-containing protein